MFIHKKKRRKENKYLTWRNADSVRIKKHKKKQKYLTEKRANWREENQLATAAATAAAPAEAQLDTAKGVLSTGICLGALYGYFLRPAFGSINLYGSAQAQAPLDKSKWAR